MQIQQILIETHWVAGTAPDPQEGVAAKAVSF